MRKTFKLSAEYQAITVLDVGYLGEPNALQEPFKSRELSVQTRLPLEELLLA